MVMNILDWIFIITGVMLFFATLIFVYDKPLALWQYRNYLKYLEYETCVKFSYKKLIGINYKNFPDIIIRSSSYTDYRNKSSYPIIKYKKWYIKLNFIDFCRLLSDLKDEKKYEEKRAKNKITEEFLTSLLEDIDKQKKEAEKLINKGKDELETWLINHT